MGLTNIKANNGGGKKDKGRIEDGTYMARVVQLIDLGVQKSEYEGVEKINHQVMITFEFPTEMVKVGDDDKPRWLSKNYTVSTHEKSGMAALINAVDPTGQATSKGRNLKGILGLPAMVTVGTTSGGNAKVSGVARLMKGMQVPELVNDPVFFDLDGDDVEQFDKFPDWLKERITSGIDFHKTPFSKAIDNGSSSSTEEEEFDGEIPF